MVRQLLELRHIDLFHEKGSILFERLFSYSKSREYLLHSFKSPRNTWKYSPLCRQFCLNKEFARIAMQLSHLSILQFGYDHYFPDIHVLSQFFCPTNNSSLKELSSIDGIEIGLLLNLSPPKEQPEACSMTLPSVGESGMFFSPEFLLDFSHSECTGPFLLLTYCKPGARYLYKPLDPFTHDAKKESRAFGDILASDCHPLFTLH